MMNSYYSEERSENDISISDNSTISTYDNFFTAAENFSVVTIPDRSIFSDNSTIASITDLFKNKSNDNYNDHDPRRTSKQRKKIFEQYLADIDLPQSVQERRKVLLERNKKYSRQNFRSSNHGSTFNYCRIIFLIPCLLSIGLLSTTTKTRVLNIMESMIGRIHSFQNNRRSISLNLPENDVNATTYLRLPIKNDNDLKDTVTEFTTSSMSSKQQTTPSQTDKELKSSSSLPQSSSSKAINVPFFSSSLQSQQQDNSKINVDSIWDHLVDTMNFMVDDIGDFTPFFFHVPRNGGQMIQEIVRNCLHKVQANEVGTGNGHHKDIQLQTVEIGDSKYINVDVSTEKGIERAAKMGFGTDATQPDIMVTSSYFLTAVKHLFSTKHPGRAFILLRNPISRAVSMYHHHKSVGIFDPELTLEDYARGDGIENNWVVRYLTNRMEGELQNSHLDQAKKILSKKFLIGFLDDIEESVFRMIKYNGWDFEDVNDDNEGVDEEESNFMFTQNKCITGILKEGRNNKDNEELNDPRIPEKDSMVYKLLSWQTQFDMKLYEFAKDLFQYQSERYGFKEKRRKKSRMNKNKKVSK